MGWPSDCQERSASTTAGSSVAAGVHISMLMRCLSAPPPPRAPGRACGSRWPRFHTGTGPARGTAKIGEARRACAALERPSGATDPLPTRKASP
ncbi:hypothetical protein GCM10022377_19750 [Zhihengliuella alba]|uniref:Uncharacterized protein n=1 Tax=Zhihengliuella alba TaxID=547018 RepID=A0ABP7DLD5_9MICC